MICLDWFIIWFWDFEYFSCQTLY